MKCGYSAYLDFWLVHKNELNKTKYKAFFKSLSNGEEIDEKNFYLEYSPIFGSEICDLEVFYEKYIFNALYKGEKELPLKFLVIAEEEEKVPNITINGKCIVEFIKVSENVFYTKLKELYKR
ncbi:hypothetical protein MLC52_05205 [Sulfurimonas sp. NW15]|uniref:hypothetical protein n=1 Tax=Sulfurimonas sp. NW15 TaxID=2922729 RepID=UPI003DA8A261